jgi:hypothetical protein
MVQEVKSTPTPTTSTCSPFASILACFIADANAAFADSILRMSEEDVGTDQASTN